MKTVYVLLALTLLSFSTIAQTTYHNERFKWSMELPTSWEQTKVAATPKKSKDAPSLLGVYTLLSVANLNRKGDGWIQGSYYTHDNKQANYEDSRKARQMSYLKYYGKILPNLALTGTETIIELDNTPFHKYEIEGKNSKGVVAVHAAFLERKFGDDVLSISCGAFNKSNWAIAWTAINSATFDWKAVKKQKKKVKYVTEIGDGFQLKYPSNFISRKASPKDYMILYKQGPNSFFLSVHTNLQHILTKDTDNDQFKASALGNYMTFYNYFNGVKSNPLKVISHKHFNGWSGDFDYFAKDGQKYYVICMMLKHQGQYFELMFSGLADDRESQQEVVNKIMKSFRFK